MKPFYILLYIFITSSIIHSQWINQNPIPNGNELRSVFFIDDNIGWMVGSDGFITKTTNAGVDWIQQTSGTTTYLKSVKFVDENNGYVVGESGLILKTANGGSDWFHQSSGTDKILDCVFFYDINLGWASGYGGVLLKTSNGGVNWTSHVIDTSYVLSSVFFVDPNIGWVVGRIPGTEYVGEESAIILKTSDGGQSWITQSHPLSNNRSRLYSVQFLDENNGWAVGGNDFGIEAPSVILNTTNGGFDWTLKFAGWATGNKLQKPCQEDEQIGFKSVFFKDAMNGVAVGGDDGGWCTYIVSTTDGGNTWVEKYALMEFKPALFSVYVTKAGKGWAVGEDGFIIISDDNGISWCEQLSGTRYNINSQFFVNKFEGWISGSSGNRPFIMHTTNYGKVWKTQYPGAYMEGPFNNIFFYSELVGWAVGEEGIRNTANGGNDWINMGGSYISSVFFIDQNMGWIVGSKISKTTDGGANWIDKSSIGGVSIYFADEFTGWVVGSNGSILKSIDGGETWIAKTSGTTTNLKCVKFYDTNVGMSVGSAGTVLLSTDGGETWVSKGSSTSENLNCITFTNSTSVWIAGDNDNVLHTSDLGNNWLGEYQLTGNSLKSIFFVDENTGWIGGEGGTIYMYENESPVPVELISFIAKLSNSQVTLNWSTATELNNNGFDVERKICNGQSSTGNFEKISFVKGAGTTSESQDYLFTDKNLINGKYIYRLKQIDLDGTSNYSNEIEVNVESPTDFLLAQNYPNPFNPTTKIRYQLPNESKVVIKIYNILGAEVLELFNEQKAAGVYEVEFNAESLSSGTYFYKISVVYPSSSSGQVFVQTKKMVLLK